MKQINVQIPAGDISSGVLTQTPIIKSISSIGLPGPTGPQGPGIASNITRITASVDPPSSPQENDLWIDLS